MKRKCEDDTASNNTQVKKPKLTPPIQTITYPEERYASEQADAAFKANLENNTSRYAHVIIRSPFCNRLPYSKVQQALELCSNYQHIKQINILDYSLVSEIPTTPVKAFIALNDLLALLEKNPSIISLQCNVSNAALIIPLLERLQQSFLLNLKLEIEIASSAYLPDMISNITTVLQKNKLSGLHLVLCKFSPNIGKLRLLENNSSLVHFLCTTHAYTEDITTTYYAPKWKRVLEPYLNTAALFDMPKEAATKVKLMLEYLVWYGLCLNPDFYLCDEDKFILSKSSDFEHALALLTSSRKRWHALGICKYPSPVTSDSEKYTIHSLPIEILAQIFSYIRVSDIPTSQARS